MNVARVKRAPARFTKADLKTASFLTEKDNRQLVPIGVFVQIPSRALENVLNVALGLALELT